MKCCCPQGKENSNPRVVNRPVNTSLPSQRESDSYDADSEPDGNQPLFQDQCLPSHLSERVPSFHSDHSTPTVQVVGTWPTLPFSPVGIPQPPLGPDTPHNSGHMAPSVPSPRKRKPDVGFYDVPFTKPKRSKRKTKAVPDHQVWLAGNIRDSKLGGGGGGGGGWGGVAFPVWSWCWVKSSHDFATVSEFLVAKATTEVKCQDWSVKYE